MTLYEITNEIELRNRLEDSETNSEETIKILEILENNYIDKLERYGKVLQNIKSDIEALSEEIKRLSGKKESLERSFENLKNGIKESMIRLNMRQVKTPLFSFSISNSIPKIEIGIDAKIPKEFLTYKEPQVNKIELKKAIQDGLIVDGVRLLQGKRLVVK